MKNMRLPIRYLRRYPLDEEEPCESNIVHETVTDELDPRQTAMILVDIRNTGVGTKPLHPEVSLRHEQQQAGGINFIERSRKIVEEKIKPIVKSARDIGISIIHEANTPKHHDIPQYIKWYEPDAKSPVSEWPPPEIARKHRQEKADRGLKKGYWEKKAKIFKLYDLLIPIEDNDFVVSTHASTQKLLKHLGVINLIYVGFMLNDCVMDKGAGLLNMRTHGYKIILLRDCTTGFHTKDTLPNLMTDKVWIDYVETGIGYTSTAKDFITACRTKI